MAQLTNAQMRAVVQELVLDTNSSYPGLANADYTVLINDAMQAYADMFPDTLGLSGIVASPTLGAGNKSVTVAFNSPPPILRSITGAFLQSTGPLQRRDVLDILRQQVATPALGAPSQYALTSSAPGVAASALAYTLHVWPASDGSYTVNLYGTVQPTALSADNDYSVFQDAECRIIARMAAMDAARLLGRGPDFVQALGASLPDRVKAQMQVIVRDLAPRAYEGKAVA